MSYNQIISFGRFIAFCNIIMSPRGRKTSKRATKRAPRGYWHLDEPSCNCPLCTRASKRKTPASRAAPKNKVGKRAKKNQPSTSASDLMLSDEEMSPPSGATNRAPRGYWHLDEPSCNCPLGTCASKRKTPASRAAPKNKAGKRAKKSQPSTSASNWTLSDDEMAPPVINDIAPTQVDNIKNKVDKFFKTMESSDEEEEIELKLNKEPKENVEKKGKDFYTLISDSDEDIMPCTSTNIKDPIKISTSQPGTSGLNTENVSLNNEKTNESEDLFHIVDDIIDNCADMPEIPEDTSKPFNKTLESFEAYKKKTEEMLESVSSLIDGFHQTAKKSETNSEPKEKLLPSCPICLENLGEGRQAMATFCGHMFCQDCISTVARTTKKCPTCRKQVSLKKIHPVYI